MLTLKEQEFVNVLFNIALHVVLSFTHGAKVPENSILKDGSSKKFKN